MLASRSICSGDIYITEPCSLPALVMDTPTSRSGTVGSSAFRRIIAVPDLGQPPIQQQDLAVGPNQYVVGLDVTVQHPNRVSVPECVADLSDDIHEL